MAKVGFIGVGNMGGPMTRNLLQAGHEVKAFDLSEEALNFVVQSGAVAVASPAEAATAVDFVVTMLPVGANVREAVLDGGVLEAASPGTLMIDSSTIDVDTSRDLHAAAEAAGFEMLDAPVSGGTVGADAATLTFMCGGSASAFAKARPLLDDMGRNIIHCGGPGLGQATKICNNMLAGINSLAVSEAFVMGDKLGVDPKTLYDVLSTSTGNSYILSQSCPMPGVLPAAASSNNFKPGFAAKLMLKDMRLSQAAAQAAGVATPLGAVATAAYAAHIEHGNGELDSTSIIKQISSKF